jgi:5-(carboxyamino)imidazole ribonucleotide mutase
MTQIDLSTQSPAPLVGIIMGSKSDWETMRHTHETLLQLAIPHECRIISAHRTPELLQEYSAGAAHLPDMAGAFAPPLPVLGVPVGNLTIGKAGAILGNSRPEVRECLSAFRTAQKERVLADELPLDNAQ